LSPYKRYIKETKDDTKTLCLETAGPAKFPESIKEVLGIEPKLPKSMEKAMDKEEHIIKLDNDYQKFKEIIISSSSKKTNITLIGMSGAGKSSIGRLLAEHLNYNFIDPDIIINKKYADLQDIINKKGEKKLLDIEENTLLDLNGKNTVFAPGGSCIYSDKAMQHLKKISVVIFIDPPYSRIKKNLSTVDIKKRGIIGLKENKLKELYDSRKGLYKRYKDISVKTTGDDFKKDMLSVLKTIKI
jgi:shikimate kinase